MISNTPNVAPAQTAKATKTVMKEYLVLDSQPSTKTRSQKTCDWRCEWLVDAAAKRGEGRKIIVPWPIRSGPEKAPRDEGKMPCWR